MSSYNEESQEAVVDLNELYGVRDGTLFIVDASPPMFENHSRDRPEEKEVSYFVQSIRRVKESLKQKLSWNRQDWMGLVFFGTKECDPNSDMKNILTIQKLLPVSIDCLKEVIKIDEKNKWEQYRDSASSTDYPLHDVLWHAAQLFHDKNVTMPLRRVILFTCQDNPQLTSDEKHRIRAQAKAYNDLNIKLFVVGLGESWDHNLFYKDLEILSRDIDADNYKTTSLNDLMDQVVLLSRNMSKLAWRFGQDVNIDVVLRNLVAKTQYLKKENMSKETNAPLTSKTCYVVAKEVEDEENENDEDEIETSQPVASTDLEWSIKYGGESICFTSREKRSMKSMRPAGIDVVCMKPISSHLLYHFETPYFVLPSDKSTRKDNALLFDALLNKCNEKELMIIVLVTIRKYSIPLLYTMLPNVKKGGFYLYRIPYKEDVRSLSDILSQYVFNDETKCPFSPKAVELLEEIIKRIGINDEPKMCSNPKLQSQFKAVETLALDLEKSEPIVDDTLPQTEKMRKCVKDLLEEYNEIFKSDEPPTKKSKKIQEAAGKLDTMSKEQIRELVKNNTIDGYTVAQLKMILETLPLKRTGKKDELIKRLKDYFNN
ncbi:X-ray repair cross-complementing protein 6-like isoform X2 [Ceratina calcarata]|nr:X-ray repair cross-complementing protein 6-like isoform X2 [Ceratina calcarata]